MSADIEPEQSDPTQCTGEEGFCPEHGFHRHSLKQPGEPESPLRQQLADAVRRWTSPNDRHAAVDAVLVVILPHGKLLGDMLRESEERLAETRATLDEVLRHFVHKGHPGEPCLSSGWVSEKTVARWRATLNPPQPAPDAGPSVQEAAEADRNWDVEQGGE